MADLPQKEGTDRIGRSAISRFRPLSARLCGQSPQTDIALADRLAHAAHQLQLRVGALGGLPGGEQRNRLTAADAAVDGEILEAAHDQAGFVHLLAFADPILASNSTTFAQCPAAASSQVAYRCVSPPP